MLSKIGVTPGSLDSCFRFVGLASVAVFGVAVFGIVVFGIVVFGVTLAKRRSDFSIVRG